MEINSILAVISGKHTVLNFTYIPQGGVVSMSGFLDKIFPSIAVEASTVSSNLFCQYNNNILQLVWPLTLKSRSIASWL